MSELTILCPIAGRREFDRRFEVHLSKLPFRILFHKDPERVPVRDWFLKIVALLERVETSYAMIADNDDFPTIDLKRCVSFLNRNPEYACCSGRIRGFWLWPDPIVGPHSAISRQYATYDTPADYSQDDRNARVLAGFANSWSYYGVYRIETLRRVWHEVLALGLTDLRVHEKFCAMRTLTMGKVRCDPSFTSLYRQYGTSQGAVSYVPGNWGDDIGKVLVMMSGAGVDRPELARRWNAWYRSRDRYLEGKWRKRAKALFPNLAWYVQNRHRYLPHQELPI